MELNKEWLKSKGFEGFEKISEMKVSKNRKIIPTKKGVYVIIDESDENSKIVYIGQAGGKKSQTNLRKRLSQYMRKSKNHSGGRDIWKLKNPEDLLVAWKSTLEDPYDGETDEPAVCETCGKTIGDVLEAYAYHCINDDNCVDVEEKCFCTKKCWKEYLKKEIDKIN